MVFSFLALASHQSTSLPNGHSHIGVVIRLIIYHLSYMLTSHYMELVDSHSIINSSMNNRKDTHAVHVGLAEGVVSRYCVHQDDV